MNQTRVCPNCGSDVKSADIFCFECGSSYSLIVNKKNPDLQVESRDIYQMISCRMRTPNLALEGMVEFFISGRFPDSGHRIYSSHLPIRIEIVAFLI